MEELKNIETISRYLDGTLSDADKQLLEQELATDAALRQTFEEVKEAILAVQLAQMDSVIAVLRAEQAKSVETKSGDLPKSYDLDAEKRGKVGTVLKKDTEQMSFIYKLNSPKMRQILAYAATVLLGTWGIWQLISTPKENKTESLIVGYFEPYTTLGITKGGDTITFKLDALQKYENKDYKEAVPLFDKAFKTEQDSFLLFYKSIALIGSGQSAKAIADLEVLQTSTTVPSELLVQWYLALAYLDSNQKEKAVPLLQKVANTEGGNKGKAVELLGKVK